MSPIEQTLSQRLYLRIRFLFALLLIATSFLHAQPARDTIRLADPTIFFDNGTYYLYGTSSPDGFLVYTSTDLVNWSGPAGKRRGHALLKGDSFGTSGFWAPQVFRYRDKYYMAYTANEKIAIAQSDDPLGPFTQSSFSHISGVARQIDPYLFIDTDGQLYLYHVRVEDGNRIFVAKMKDDLSDIIPETVTECIKAEEPWENTDNAPWPVAEGPTVIKHQNRYYLFYSANDFRNSNYSVGSATATSPTGPWKKYSGNPIISRANTLWSGTGHGDLFTGAGNKLYYVFHTHSSNEAVGKRKSAIINISFVRDRRGTVVAIPQTFHHLLTALQR